ncbi:MFS transporter [Paraburkholderia sediminicola]|uniref:MFS transporter n=1 Tax=Paraburkholderia TaxID=1822464 RepID=UPI0038B7532E
MSQAARARTAHSRRLSEGASFHLQASIISSFLAGSSAPTALYAVYQSSMGFSATMLTVIFGVYSIGVLAALLVFGRLSDHIGRRPVLLAATLAQAAAMLLFIESDSTWHLLAARLVQGLITGAAVGAAGAAMLDINKQAGGVANSVAPPIGTALGGLLSGLFVQFLPAPTALIYVCLAAIYLFQFACLLQTAETVTSRAGAIRSLVPRLALPSMVRRAVLRAISTLVATWAVAGFYASLGPKLMRGFGGNHAALLGGFALAVFSAIAAASVLATQKAQPLKMLKTSSVALLVGLLVSAIGIKQTSLATFMIGTALLGVGYGTGFQGSIRSVAALLAPEARAGALSVLFIVSYFSMGVPAILAGYRLTATGNVQRTAEELGIAALVLAIAALLAELRGHGQRSSGE